MRTRRFVPLFALVLPIAMGGCQPKAVRGGEGTENPNLDEGALSTTLDRKDLTDLSNKNLGELMASRIWAEWRGAPKQPVIAIWPIKNDTTEHLDDQMLSLLSEMETQFVNGGVVQVVSRERQAELISEANLQQTADFNPAIAAEIGKQLGAQYFVTGKLQAVDERNKKTRRVQYFLYMQVLEVETGAIKFQTKSERSKALVR